MNRKYLLFYCMVFLFCCFMAGCGSKKVTTPYEKGEIIEFGTSLTDDSKKMEWIVLECKEDEALLISKDIIAYRSFHSKTNTSTEWHNSDICIWLNNDFYTGAFSEDERAKILECEIATLNYNSKTADSTKNHVFLLNIQEAKDYVIGKKYAGTVLEDSYNGWLLRDKAETQSHIAYVNKEGEIKEDAGVVMNVIQGIRPAIWIRLEQID